MEITNNRPKEKLLVTIDTSEGPEGTVVIGSGGHAEAGHIQFANGAARLTVTEDGASCPDHEVVGKLREIFGGTDPGAVAAFKITTPKASLLIDADGVVTVNGRKVGRDPEILVRAVVFLLVQYVGRGS